MHTLEAKLALKLGSKQISLLEKWLLRNYYQYKILMVIIFLVLKKLLLWLREKY